MRRVWLSLFVMASMGGAAMAQDVDPIGDLLGTATKPLVAPSAPLQIPEPTPAQPQSPVQSPTPTLTPDVAAAPSPPPSPKPEPTIQFGSPVHIDELGRTPDAPPTPSDLNYESRIRSTFNAAQGMQGPLDGRWVLKVNGVETYYLQLVDKGQGRLEGAWRDPSRQGALDASGFIDEIQNIAGHLTLKFKTRRNGTETVDAVFEAEGTGQWSGGMIVRGERRSATLSRN